MECLEQGDAAACDDLPPLSAEVRESRLWGWGRRRAPVATPEPDKQVTEADFKRGLDAAYLAKLPSKMAAKLWDSCDGFDWWFEGAETATCGEDGLNAMIENEDWSDEEPDKEKDVCDATKELWGESSGGNCVGTKCIDAEQKAKVVNPCNALKNTLKENLARMHYAFHNDNGMGGVAYTVQVDKGDLTNFPDTMWIVAFQGTDDLYDVTRDLQSATTGRIGLGHPDDEVYAIGHGFKAAYKTLGDRESSAWVPDLEVRSKGWLTDDLKIHCSLTKKGWLKSTRVLVTGHSLGGALATLAAIELHNTGCNVDLQTFGQPRALNNDGVHMSTDCEPWWDPRCKDLGAQHVMEEIDGDFTVTRWVNEGDAVPAVPPGWMGFGHIGKQQANGEGGVISLANNDAAPSSHVYKTATKYPNYSGGLGGQHGIDHYIRRIAPGV